MFKQWLKNKLISEEEGRQVSKNLKEGGIVSTQIMSNALERIKAKPDDYWDYEKNKPDVNSMRILEGLSLHNAYAVASLWRKQVEKGECKV